MKIIVLGAGKVGKTLIKHMSNEDHDIIVVDQNATKVEEVVNQYDVIGVVGNGGSYDILMEAGAEDANLIICVTTSDELNILAGLKLNIKNPRQAPIIIKAIVISRLPKLCIINAKTPIVIKNIIDILDGIQKITLLICQSSLLLCKYYIPRGTIIIIPPQ